MKKYLLIILLFSIGIINAQTTSGETILNRPPVPIGPCDINPSMTGGGVFCEGGVGLPLGLTFSDPGVSYQLRRNGVNVGLPIIGLLNFEPISFGFFNVSGIYSVEATYLLGECSNRVIDSTATVSITTSQVTPIFNTIVTICSGSNLVLPTTSINGISGTWQPDFNPFSTTTYLFTPNEGQCATPTEITITVNSTPTPIAISSQTFSEGATLSNIIVNGSSLKWYTNSTLGNEIANSTPLINGITYYVSQNISGCESNRLPILITVIPLPLGTTVILPSQCGITLSSTGSYVYANLVPNAQRYRFRVKHLGTNEIQIKEYLLRNLLLSSMSFFKYDQEYQIEVAVKRNNIWENYGAACNVRTPVALTKVILSQCGTTLSSQNEEIYADLVVKAKGYQFKITNLNTNSVQIIDRVLRSFQFSLVTDYTPATSYKVEIAVKNTDDSYLPFGQLCILTTSGFIDRQIEKNEAVFKATGYPNPFENNFSISLDSNSNENVSLMVYDLLGRQVESKEFKANSTIEDLGIEYPTGVYNVIIIQGSNYTSIKMIKR